MPTQAKQDNPKVLNFSSLPSFAERSDLPTNWQLALVGRQSSFGRSGTLLREVSLSGGAQAKILKQPGIPVYAAAVKLNGKFPEEGYVAKVMGHTEVVSVYSGSFEIQIEGKRFQAQRGDSVIINDGESFTIQGNGQLFVLLGFKKTPRGRAVMKVQPLGEVMGGTN